MSYAPSDNEFRSRVASFNKAENKVIPHPSAKPKGKVTKILAALEFADITRPALSGRHAPTLA